MNNLVIKDLEINRQLDQEVFSSVMGGCYHGFRIRWGFRRNRTRRSSRTGRFFRRQLFGNLWKKNLMSGRSSIYNLSYRPIRRF